jgi:hypothetical protein
MEEKRNTYRALMKKPEDGRPIVRPKHRWEGYIKMDLKVRVIRWEGVDWFHPAQDRHRWRALVTR